MAHLYTEIGPYIKLPIKLEKVPYKTKVCPKCAQEIRSKFCPFCGTEAQEEITMMPVCVSIVEIFEEMGFKDSQIFVEFFTEEYPEDPSKVTMYLGPNRKGYSFDYQIRGTATRKVTELTEETLTQIIDKFVKDHEEPLRLLQAYSFKSSGEELEIKFGVVSYYY